MTVTTTPNRQKKPGKGRPTTEADKAAVLAMEQDVVHRHAVQGHSFYRIEQDLGITHADRIYKRAMSVRPVQQRAEAYEVQRQRLDALHEKAWTALEGDGLDSLAYRVAEILHEGFETSDWDDVPLNVRATIERAYADTYRGIPVALGVHDRFVKLDGLDHAARIADAHLALDQAKIQVWAAALADSLGLLDATTEQKKAVVTRFGELLEASETEDAE
jgi:hypothetical protein